MEDKKPIISFAGADILNGEATVIYGLDMDIYPGDFVYIVGKVGTGKTSIIRTMIAENSLHKGQGTVCGYDLVDIRVAEDDHVAVVADLLVHRLVLVRPALQIRLDRDRDGGVVLLGAGNKVLGVVEGYQRHARDRRVVLADGGLVVGVLNEVADRAAVGIETVDGEFPAVYRYVHAVTVYDIDDVVAEPIEVRLSLGTKPLLNSSGSSSKSEMKEVCLLRVAHFINISPPAKSPAITIKNTSSLNQPIIIAI